MMKLSNRCNDLTYQKFGRLTAIKPVGKTKFNCVVWLCKCDCGKEKIIIGNNLINGNTKSCGCLQVGGSNKKFIPQVLNLVG